MHDKLMHAGALDPKTREDVQPANPKNPESTAGQNPALSAAHLLA